MCKCFCFSATATSTLHCQMFPHPPPRDVFGPSVKFQDAKTKKTIIPRNDRFLINFLLKNAVFGSSERLPPLSAVPPTNKKTHPPISKPHPAKKIFFPTTLFSCATAFVFLQQLHQHCIARCFPIHLPGMCLVHLLNFKTPKPKK